MRRISRKFVKRSKKRSVKRSRKRSVRRYRSKCKKYLRDKIAININEYKQGRYTSKAQAIAVSYSQIRKKHPSCKRILSRKRL